MRKPARRPITASKIEVAAETGKLMSRFRAMNT